MKKLSRLIIFIGFIVAMDGYSQKNPNEKSKTTFGYWLKKMQDTTQNFNELVKEFDRFCEGKTHEEISGYKQFRRWQKINTGMTDETGRLLPPDHIDKEYYRFIENYPPD
nr:hypothetical protein [Bacteroidota bacterium]